MPVSFLLWWGKLRKLAGKYPSLSIEPSAREFGGGYADACGNGKIRTHTPPDAFIACASRDTIRSPIQPHHNGERHLRVSFFVCRHRGLAHRMCGI